MGGSVKIVNRTCHRILPNTAMGALIKRGYVVYVERKSSIPKATSCPASNRYPIKSRGGGTEGRIEQCIFVAIYVRL